MKRWLLLAVLGLLAGCGSSTPPPPQYATASDPVGLCPLGSAVRGEWYCDQTTVTAMISPGSDGNYTAYAEGTYNASLTGVSCTFTVSTIKVMDGSTTCYITTQ